MVHKRKIILLTIFMSFSCLLFGNEFYNSLVDDLLNSSSYGYKGMNLETRQINFSNSKGADGFIITKSETAFYIKSEKGFFMVENNNHEILYTRDGDFVKRGDEYYLARDNYLVKKKIENLDGVKKTLIFHPSENSSVERIGRFFKFSDGELINEEIIPNRLEMPNTDPIKILIKMKEILRTKEKKYRIQLEIINQMLNVLISDKMHAYYIEQSYLNFDIEKYQIQNQLVWMDELQFKYSTSWSRTFSEYIKLLYIE